MADAREAGAGLTLAALGALALAACAPCGPPAPDAREAVLRLAGDAEALLPEGERRAVVRVRRCW